MPADGCRLGKALALLRKASVTTTSSPHLGLLMAATVGQQFKSVRNRPLEGTNVAGKAHSRPGVETENGDRIAKIVRMEVPHRALPGQAT